MATTRKVLLSIVAAGLVLFALRLSWTSEGREDGSPGPSPPEKTPATAKPATDLQHAPASEPPADGADPGRGVVDADAQVDEGLLEWEDAEPLAREQARALWERDREFRRKTLTWQTMFEDRDWLRKELRIPEDDDAALDAALRELEVETADVDYRLEVAGDQFTAALERAFETTLTDAPAYRSRRPEDPEKALEEQERAMDEGERGGGHGIQVEAGGWHVHYRIRTAAFPELQRLGTEINDLVKERIQATRAFSRRR